MRPRHSSGKEAGAPYREPHRAHGGFERRFSAWLRSWGDAWPDFALPQWLDARLRQDWQWASEMLCLPSLNRHRRHGARWAARWLRLPPPPGFGIAASVLLIGAALGYGVVVGGHLPAVTDWAKDTRDAAANSLGFRIDKVSVSGEKEVSREEILTTAGVTGRASLLFLDAEAARTRLLANPWIADAAVLKLYPDRLQIAVTERRAFALWQKNGRVSVVAADGTVLESFVEPRYLGLPLVVGQGAERRAQDFLAVADRYPDIRSKLRASILVAQRRWNLLLTNGMMIELPETDVAAAMDRLVALDHDRKLLSRDVTTVDLRLADRVTVRLSAAAAQARDEAAKDNKKKKKGGSA